MSKSCCHLLSFNKELVVSMKYVDVCWSILNKNLTGNSVLCWCLVENAGICVEWSIENTDKCWSLM